MSCIIKAQHDMYIIIENVDNMALNTTKLRGMHNLTCAII